MAGEVSEGVELAVKFSQALNISPMFWLDLQAEDDIAKGLCIINKLGRLNGSRVNLPDLGLTL